MSPWFMNTTFTFLKRKKYEKVCKKKLHSYFGSRPGFEPMNQQNDTFDVNLRLSYRGHNLKY